MAGARLLGPARFVGAEFHGNREKMCGASQGIVVSSDGMFPSAFP